MQHLTFLIKPASSLCNMRCRYCFYEDVSDNRLQKQMGIMTASTAQRIILEAFRAISKNGTITFFFQGGEPTLAGLDFFRNFVQLEKALKKPGVAVYHGIQTNGYCIDEEWASFFGRKTSSWDCLWTDYNPSTTPSALMQQAQEPGHAP